MKKTSRTKAFASLTAPTVAKSLQFGARLKEARHRRAWTLAYAEKITGISKTTLKQIEKGEPSVGWGYMLVLLQVYGMISELDGLCHANKDLLSPVPRDFIKNNDTASFDNDLE